MIRTTCGQEADRKHGAKSETARSRQVFRNWQEAGRDADGICRGPGFVHKLPPVNNESNYEGGLAPRCVLQRITQLRHDLRLLADANVIYVRDLEGDQFAN